MRTRKGSKFEKAVKVPPIKNPITIPDSPKRTWDLPTDLISMRVIVGFPKGLATVKEMEDYLKTDVGKLMPKNLRKETDKWISDATKKKD